MKDKREKLQSKKPQVDPRRISVKAMDKDQVVLLSTIAEHWSHLVFFCFKENIHQSEEPKPSHVAADSKCYKLSISDRTVNEAKTYATKMRNRSEINRRLFSLPAETSIAQFVKR